MKKNILFILLIALFLSKFSYSNNEYSKFKAKPLVFEIISIVTQDVTGCYGNADGSIVITISGGFAPYYYSIDGGLTYQLSNTFTGLISKYYPIKVKDLYNTIVTGSANINQPNQILISEETHVNVTGCYGNANGEISITASGGSGTLLYSIDNGINYFSTGIFTGLFGGTYQVKVKDSNNCIKIGSLITISQPSQVSITNEIINNVTGCIGGTNGSITITGAGGSFPLQYSINGGLSYQAGNTFNGLPAGGPHQIKIKDSNNCSATGSSITITQPTQVQINSESSTNVNTCYGDATGSITISASGGTVEINYSIDGNSYVNNGNFVNLFAGTYNVSVRDAQNCIVTGSQFILTQPSQVNIISETKNDVTGCAGDLSGQISINASGGTLPLYYSIDGGTIYQLSNVFNSLPFGSYSVYVKDSKTCIKHGGYHEISQPTPITIYDVSSTNVTTCFGGNDGSINISAYGGVSPFYYSVDNGLNYSTNQNITSLISGNYVIKVKDSHNCSSVYAQNILITQPTQVVINSVTPQDPSCFGGANGSVNISASGGIGMLNYSVNGGTNYFISNIISNLSANISYQIKVKDQHQCTATGSVVILSQPTQIIINNINKNNISTCNGGNDGSIEIIASGGTSNLLYSINSGINFYSSNLFQNLTAGNYYVIVKDGNNCITNGITVTLTQPDPLIISTVFQTNVIGCKGAATGTISITSTGGTVPISYSIDGGITFFENSGIFTGLTAGNYNIVIRDSKFCTKTGQMRVITEPELLVFSQLDHTNLDCNGVNNGTITIAAQGGKPGYNFSIDGGISYSQQNYYTNLNPGLYPIFVKDAYNCVLDGSTITIESPSHIVINSVTKSNITSCFGSASGSILINAIGGSGILKYSINGGLNYYTNNNFQNLPAGTYSIFVKDENSCIEIWSSSVVISQPSQILISLIQQTNILCFGNNNGTMSIFAAGGTGNLHYSIDNGVNYYDNGGLFTDLFGGLYKIYIKDDNNCTTARRDLTIYEPNELIITSVTITDETCNGSMNGKISIMPYGGTAPYAYSIDGTNYQTSNIINNLSAGIYTLYLKDANNCIATKDNVIINSPQSTIGFSADVVKGCSPLKVSFTKITTGYEYLWNFDDGTLSNEVNPIHTFVNNSLDTMYFNVLSKYTSLAGCKDSTEMKITVYPIPALDFSISSTILTFPNTTLLIQNLTTDPNAFNFLWDFGDGKTSTEFNPVSHEYLICSNYTLTLSASNVSCNNTITKNISIVTDNPTAEMKVDTLAACTPATFTFQNISQNVNDFYWVFKNDTIKSQLSFTEIFDIPGEYSIFLKTFGNCGLEAQLDTMVSVWSSPKVGFSVAPDTVMPPSQPIHCYNKSDPTCSFLWDFGDGTSSTEFEPNHIYQVNAQGHKDIKLYVKSVNNCVDSMILSSSVYVLEVGNIVFPTAFTPNGDGINDFFIPVDHSSVEKYKLKIFNSWGTQIFDSNKIEEGWDGKYKNKTAATGVYMWQVSGTYQNGKTYLMSGSLTLVRNK